MAPGGTTTYFDALDQNVWVTPGWLNPPDGYDLMITSDHNFQGGSPLGAPGAGEHQTVVLSLGDTDLTVADLEAAFSSVYASQTSPGVIARFQSVGPGGEASDSVTGTPEPAALALLLLGSRALWPRRRSAGI